jgi:hypothetical protein
VVIPQVQFNKLPGRLKSPYGGDHYVVIVGIEGNSFIYNDPIDSDGRGYGRLITAEQLEKAMTNAHGEFSKAAFAVGKYEQPPPQPRVAYDSSHTGAAGLSPHWGPSC